MGVAFKSLALASVLSRYILQFSCAQQGETKTANQKEKRKNSLGAQSGVSQDDERVPRPSASLRDVAQPAL